jgi:uncharacterized protein YndB with AHSA1/START domain
MNESTPIFVSEPLVVSRVLRASPERVFKAWSRAEFVRKWFAPDPCTVPAIEVDFRPGGVFDVTMQLPDGTRHEMRAAFTILEPPGRLGFAGTVHAAGKLGFHFDTVVTLTPDPAGARIDVKQTYEIHDETFRFAIDGAREGWKGTLSNLERELLAETPRSAVHGVFTIRRTFKAAPERLFRAFTDPDAKARWFTGHEGFVLKERTMDVRVGGRERLEGRHASGLVTAFDAIYFDVIPGERLVYTYEMRLDGRKISVSLATLTFAPDPNGALLVVTEQGTFLDGYDDSGSREHGTNWLLDAVERSLSEH